MPNFGQKKETERRSLIEHGVERYFKKPAKKYYSIFFYTLQQQKVKKPQIPIHFSCQMHKYQQVNPEDRLTGTTKEPA